ncbi:MAG: serine protease [Silicimonas sp.]|nr:serine protease [Silicimonas sp.]
MRHVLGFLATGILTFWTQLAWAQSWVQVEAQPSEARALERAQDYAGRMGNVNAFKTGSQWHVIALGPYEEADAFRRLLELRAARQIPADSFVSDGRTFGAQIFGSGETVLPLPVPANPEPQAQPEVIVLAPTDETPAQARASERQLSRDDRARLQTALQLEGFYRSAIDASFGPGTRRAMAAWQSANGFEATGILTTIQRRQLIDGYLEIVNSLQLARVIDPEAGIEIEMPTGLVNFDRHESPFAQYKPSTEDQVRVILISQEGDGATLAALYDIMQTLEIVPLNGSRALRDRSFTLEGANDRIVSHTFARLTGGTVKGFSLIWPAGDEKRFRLVLNAMQKSFTPIDGVLPDTAGSAVQDIDLLSGLEIRRADRARSGFFIDGSGAVLTTSAAVAQCTRITLDDETEAEVAAEDAGLGLALLRPREALAPRGTAELAAAEPSLRSDIAVAGYSFGGVLTAPTLSYGTLADVKGLDGDTRVQRLAVTSEPSDAGGPVFDGSGAVLGMLLEPGASPRKLPRDVAFAADAPVLAAFLAANGISPRTPGAAEVMAPEDLSGLASDVTVLVSCYN